MFESQWGYHENRMTKIAKLTVAIMFVQILLFRYWYVFPTSGFDNLNSAHYNFYANAANLAILGVYIGALLSTCLAVTELIRGTRYKWQPLILIIALVPSVILFALVISSLRHQSGM